MERELLLKIWPRNMESNYKIRFTDDCEKRIRKLDASIVKRVLSKIGILVDFKRLNTIKELKGELKDYYRFRLGSIRIIFEVDEKTKTIWISEIGFRGSIYR